MDLRIHDIDVPLMRKLKREAYDTGVTLRTLVISKLSKTIPTDLPEATVAPEPARAQLDEDGDPIPF